MNMSNNYSNANSTESNYNSLAALLFFVYTIGYMYLLTIVCVVGTILGLICIVVFLSLNQNSNMYKYLLNKALFEFLTLLIGSMSSYGNCQNCSVYQTYGATFFRYHFFIGIINITYTCSAFAEIGVTYDRLLLLKHSRSHGCPNTNLELFFSSRRASVLR